jgi:RNA recognition motif-containing protein
LLISIKPSLSPRSFKDDSLRELFEEHGEVADAKVIVDRMSGRSRGFGFVEMANSEEAAAAIEALNGYEAEGRELKVNEAKPRDD